MSAVVDAGIARAQKAQQQYGALVEAWRSHDRADVLARYDLAARARDYFATPGAGSIAQFARDTGRSVAYVGTTVRAAKRFSRDEVARLAAQGYHWAALIDLVSASESRAAPIVRRALAGAPVLVTKAAIRALGRGPLIKERDRKNKRKMTAQAVLTNALVELSPAQAVNAIAVYLRDACPPARRDAFMDLFRRLVAQAPKPERIS